MNKIINGKELRNEIIENLKKEIKKYMIKQV